MGFRKDAYAKVWAVEPVKDTYTKARISISKKNKETGEWEDDFSGFVNFYGTGVASKAAKLNKGDRIKLGDVDVQARYVKEKNTTYYNFNIYTFEAQGENSDSGSATTSTQETIDDGDVDELPF